MVWCDWKFKVLSTYKCLNSYTFCPPGNFSLHANPNLRVCHCKQLVVPFAKTSAFYNSFFINSAWLRNSLPSHVILCANVSTFKNAVKPFFFRLMYYIVLWSLVIYVLHCVVVLGVRMCFVMVVFVFLFGSRPLYTSSCYWGPAVPLYTLVSST